MAGSPMRVYLACTIRGDRSRLAVARELGAAIEAAGHELLTGRFLDDSAEDEDGRITAAQVFERDLAWLDACDLLVAEASGSSYGVGFEVGYVLARAAARGQRVVLLYDERLRDRISRMVSGNVHTQCVTMAYTDAADARARLEQILATAAAAATSDARQAVRERPADLDGAEMSDEALESVTGGLAPSRPAGPVPIPYPNLTRR